MRKTHSGEDVYREVCTTSRVASGVPELSSGISESTFPRMRQTCLDISTVTRGKLNNQILNLTARGSKSKTSGGISTKAVVKQK